ncbi:protein Turandot Z [Drosophila ficusphila]|uniref:protein Turandot Z n=1 Tax=Drosophila ficusphila TaxID=30025 RepID=UPI0007E64ECF|nr:protein Turandot Z [Drosophila ficusphila]
MYFATRLSFVLALLFCLNGNGDASVQQDRSRLQQIQIQSRRTTDVDTQVQLAYEAIGIFDKYKGQRASDLTKEAQLNRQVNDYKRKIVIIDGVPAQGGAWDILGIFKSASEKVPDNIKKDAENLLVNSSKALVEGVVSYVGNWLLNAIKRG